jgi:hypothetical protein
MLPKSLIQSLLTEYNLLLPCGTICSCSEHPTLTICYVTCAPISNKLYAMCYIGYSKRRSDYIPIDDIKLSDPAHQELLDELNLRFKLLSL